MIESPMTPMATDESWIVVVPRAYQQDERTFDIIAPVSNSQLFVDAKLQLAFWQPFAKGLSRNFKANVPSPLSARVS
jgi:hypothetical protein